jgi:SAM-dependent methyltransferase
MSADKELDPRQVQTELNRRALERKGLHKVLSDRFGPEVNERFDQEIHALLEQHFGGRRWGSVLEVGIGIGRLAHFFHGLSGRFVGIEYSKEMFAHASYMLRDLHNTELLYCDATSPELTLPDQGFDLGILSLVLKHNSDRRARELIARLKRWSKEILLIEHVEGGASGSEIALVRPEAWYLEQFQPLGPRVSHRFKRHEDQMLFCHFTRG